jgi:hypothetical protein
MGNGNGRGEFTTRYLGWEGTCTTFAKGRQRGVESDHDEVTTRCDTPTPSYINSRCGCYRFTPVWSNVSASSTRLSCPPATYTPTIVPHAQPPFDEFLCHNEKSFLSLSSPAGGEGDVFVCVNLSEQICRGGGTNGGTDDGTNDLGTVISLLPKGNWVSHERQESVQHVRT